MRRFGGPARRNWSTPSGPRRLHPGAVTGCRHRRRERPGARAGQPVGLDAEEPVKGDVLALSPLAVLATASRRGIGSSPVSAALGGRARDEPFVVRPRGTSFYRWLRLHPCEDYDVKAPTPSPAAHFRCGRRRTAFPLPTGIVVLPAGCSNAPRASLRSRSHRHRDRCCRPRHRLGHCCRIQTAPGFRRLHGRRSASPRVTVAGSARRLASATATATSSESGRASG